MDEVTARAAQEAARQFEDDAELGELLYPGAYLRRLGPTEVVLTITSGPGGPMRYHYAGFDWNKAFPPAP